MDVVELVAFLVLAHVEDDAIGEVGREIVRAPVDAVLWRMERVGKVSVGLVAVFVLRAVKLAGFACLSGM